MNQEKELLEKVKNEVAKEKGYENWITLSLNLRGFPSTGYATAYDEVAKRYANELLKLKFGEVREEIKAVDYPFQSAAFNYAKAMFITIINKTLKEL